MSYARFAVYYTAPPGALADFGARWLGWDVARGAAVDQPALPGLAEITDTPRRYGFHGTLKPPFRLAQDADADGLAQAVAALAARTAPARAEGGLTLGRLGGFLALTPAGQAAGIARVAAACVRDLDSFRAPAGAAELARRRAAGLSPRQEALLGRWGYPYVLEEFHFHLTLSGALPPEARDRWQALARDRLPDLRAPFLLDAITLAAEREDGRFEAIHRYALTG